MSEPRDPEREQDELVRFLLETSRKKSATGESAKPPAAIRRTALWVYGLVLLGALASGYAGARLWLRSHPMPQSRWEAPVRPAVRPAGPTANVTTPSAPAPAPAAALPPTPAPSPPIAAPGTGQSTGYRVQVGAFNVRKYAQDLVTKLRARDYDAMIVDVPAGPRHRVWINAEFDRPSAARLADRLKKDGFDAVVIHP